MNRFDRLYQLYDEFETTTLRQYQNFVDVFPPVDSRVALEHWQSASDELRRRKDEIRSKFVHGDIFAEIAARATREQAFTALDLHAKYGRAFNVLVLDVDETLRSAGGTDNEIPRDTLSLLTEFHEDGVPIIICTGQTLENVKGFMIQGLGSQIVHSGDLSVVYEAGTGVFTAGHGAATKQLLYQDLDDEIVSIFDDVRAGVLRRAPDNLRRGCHLQGNEFNITLKPNFQTGTSVAISIIDEALVYLLDLLGAAIDADPRASEWTRVFYATDPEIQRVLERSDSLPTLDRETIPDSFTTILDRIDVAYYAGDAAEMGSLELNKVVGVQAALDVLSVADPFALVMGDSKSDLRVMQWLEQENKGIAAAPDHASQDVLEHVIGTDELLFSRGRSAEMLRTAYALNLLASVDRHTED